MNENFEKIDENTFIYRPKNYRGPIVLNATPSKELKEYHENSCIQANVNGKSYLKKVKK